jgi:hypothetical protein
MAAERKRTISAWIKTKMRRMGIRIDKLRGDKVFPPNQLPQANMVFPLKELPQELRIMIYAHELYHVPGATRPALLRYVKSCPCFYSIWEPNSSKLFFECSALQ